MTIPSDDKMGGRLRRQKEPLESPEERVVQVEHFFEGGRGVVVKVRRGPADAAQLRGLHHAKIRRLAGEEPPATAPRPIPEARRRRGTSVRPIGIRYHNIQTAWQSLMSGERKTLFENGSDARYLPTGHIVYAVGGSLFAVAFDLQRLKVSGPKVPMIEGVRRAPGPSFPGGGAQFSVASNGSLVYVPGAVTALWDLGVTDRRGEVKPFDSSARACTRCRACRRTESASHLGLTTARKRSYGPAICRASRR